MIKLIEEMARSSYIEIDRKEVQLKGAYRERALYEFPTEEQAYTFAMGLQKIVELFTKVKVNIKEATMH